jgi:hypothetical protein
MVPIYVNAMMVLQDDGSGFNNHPVGEVSTAAGDARSQWKLV